MTLSLAFLLPWLFGVAWLPEVSDASGIGPLRSGYGFVFGILAVTLLLRLVDAIGLPLNFPLLASILLIMTLPKLWSWRTVSWRIDRMRWNWGRYPAWQWCLGGVILVWLLLRFYDGIIEIAYRPLFPWDAWTTWGVRSRVWFALKELVPFVDPAVWQDGQESSQYTIDAWQYPPAVSLIQLWAALANGQWQDWAANLPWLLCALALGMAFYGQARVYRAGFLQSLIFTYLLLSLPILDTHVALAGYADLWMATVYSLAGIAFFQWLRTGDSAQARLALVMALTCPLVKAEGTVWLFTFLPALLAALLPLKRVLWIAAMLALSMLIWYWSGGFSLHLPGIGSLTLTPALIEIPRLGHFNLGYKANWGALADNLFVFSSWHLLWYLLPVLVLCSLPRIVADRVLLLCTVQVASGFFMLFVLFFMTGAGLWAEQYSSINRLLLHMTPLLLFYALMLFKAADREPSFAQRSL